MSYSPEPATSPGESSVPGGGAIGLAEVLQMCCLSRRSGQITFSADQSSGLVYLLHGRVVHALCGKLEGEDAIYRMLSWPPGTFTLAEDVLHQDTTIALSWEQLLLEAARRVDSGIDKASDLGASVVTTLVPSVTKRVKIDLPKITLELPDERPRVYELEAEYTHVGRASGNEVPLANPSVSNRHCIFILHGSDVVVRDLNSSNGTLVNGRRISETVLRPGDQIQVGVVQMKFEPGVRRPKLTQAIPEVRETRGLSRVTNSLPPRTTLKLPQAPHRPAEPVQIKNNSDFVKGASAISYDNLEKPEEPVKRSPIKLFVAAAVFIVLLLAGGYYYFFVLHAR